MKTLKRAKTFIDKKVVLHMGSAPEGFLPLRIKYGKEHPSTWGRLGDEATIIATRKKPWSIVFDLKFTDNTIVTDILPDFIALKAA